MTSPATSSKILADAETLAEQLVQTYDSTDQLRVTPADAFMGYRPNTIAESYRHGRAVVKILRQWQAAPELQAAGLLHSFVCKKMLNAKQIAAACNPRAAFLCRQFNDIMAQTPEHQRRGKLQVVKRVKLYMAAYCDPDLAFLGVASLWDHFTLVKRSDSSLQRAFVGKAQAVLIPLLEMLGLWELKTEVEAWVVRREINTQDYDRLMKRLIQTEETRTEAFSQVKTRLESVLAPAGILCKPPTLAQIYNPTHSEGVHPEALQKLTVNIVVPTESDCYDALRWVHRYWQPVEHQVVDHIGASKLNGYRCLETTVIVPIGNSHVRTHVNIYTPAMARINQWGLLAWHMHNQPDPNVQQAWWLNRATGYAKICAAPLGALPDILHVFTPQGQLFRFPRGCTVVDFAYQVHSEVAHQTKRFFVNGEASGPATILHHLDLIELERDSQFSGPDRTWLNTARTSRARSHIERFLKRRGEGRQKGQAVIDVELRKLSNHYRIDIPNHRIEQTLDEAARRYGFERREELLAEVAAGRVPTAPILHPLFSDEVARQIQRPDDIRLRSQQLLLAQCCKPRPGDDIIGRPRYQNGQMIRLKIHQAHCSDIVKLSGAIPLKWRLQPRLDAVARLEVNGLAKNNLLEEALALFSPHFPEITLHKVDAIARNGTARLSFTIEAKNQALLETIKNSLKQLPGHTINEVRQMRLTFAEREELVKPATLVGFNPYRRQPVQDRDMFFGRGQELAQIQEMLRTSAGIIFVQGHKRVGKTSLLLHLKKYYLNRRSKVPVFVDFQMLGNLTGPNFFYEIASAVYTDLQADNQIDQLVEPPLQELFERDPAQQLADYLTHVQAHFGFNKLVLLIDEFSRIIDAYHNGRIDDTLFQQWRGIIQSTVPRVSYVMVMQQQTYQSLQQQITRPALTPIWHLLELGHAIRLKPLNKKDAHQLIERPISNHIEYTHQALESVWRLTGGSPFLIHAFCFDLVRHVAHSGRRRVELFDLKAVQAEFMHPDQSIFAHLLIIIRSLPKATSVCYQLTQLLDQADTTASVSQLEAALPHIPPEELLKILQKLRNQHILVEPEPRAWQFASLLFSRWLAVNQALA